MPALLDRLTSNIDMNGYEPADAPQRPVGSIPSVNLEPGLNVFLRCPLPPIWQATSDSLRQYYQNNVVPQTRLFNPPASANSTGGSVVNNTFVTTGTSGGGTSTTALVISNSSVKTPAITSGAKFSGSFTLSKAFELLQVTATSPCRIQMYGTALAQSADAARPLDVSPPAGTGQNIICDVVLDTTPLIWTFQNREGANGDNPVSATIYLTVTNLDVLTDIITLSFSYIPIVT